MFSLLDCQILLILPGRNPFFKSVEAIAWMRESANFPEP
jgi:hypothetical protein